MKCAGLSLSRCQAITCACSAAPAVGLALLISLLQLLNFYAGFCAAVWAAGGPVVVMQITADEFCPGSMSL
jgi:hypothetical protein